MVELFDSDFINKIQNISLNSKLVLSMTNAGNRKSRSKGSSVEFSDYREYALGDDFRRIDWNAYGRFERLFIKLFMEEREAHVTVFIDSSKSMKWGDPDKSYASRRLAAAIGYVSLANYDRVSMVTISDKCEKSISSLSGKNSLSDILGFLQNMEYKGSTDLFKAVSAAPLKANKGISIIISDFMPPEKLEDVLKLLAYKNQEIHLCQVLAPQEINPEKGSALHLMDTESGKSMDVTTSQQLLKVYKREYEAFIHEMETICRKRAANYLLMSSDMPVEKMLRCLAEE